MNSFNYVCVSGDRIDLLADRFYGSNQGIRILSAANPAVPLDATFPLGTVLVVPIIDDDVLTSNADLPPWKQS